MTTVAILISNTDGRLSQVQWSRLVGHVRNIACRCGDLQFDGQPPGDSPYQNACIVISNVDHAGRRRLDQRLRTIAVQFGQNSIAMVAGETEFVPSPNTIYFCRCAKCSAQFESPIPDADCCVICHINGRSDWLYSNWTFDCAGEIFEESTMFNRRDRLIKVKKG